MITDTSLGRLIYIETYTRMKQSLKDPIVLKYYTGGKVGG